MAMEMVFLAKVNGAVGNEIKKANDVLQLKTVSLSLNQHG